jgi:hypothetical protein
MFTNKYPKLTAGDPLESPDVPEICPVCGCSQITLYDCHGVTASLYRCGGYYRPLPFERSPEGLPLWSGVCGRPDLAAIAAMPTAEAEADDDCHVLLSV